jgi:hypothetical protein
MGYDEEKDATIASNVLNSNLESVSTLLSGRSLVLVFTLISYGQGLGGEKLTTNFPARLPLHSL